MFYSLTLLPTPLLQTVLIYKLISIFNIFSHSKNDNYDYLKIVYFFLQAFKMKKLMQMNLEIFILILNILNKIY